MRSLLIGLAGVWGIPLYLIAAFPQHFPCENQNYHFIESTEPPIADPPAIQTGQVSSEVATTNRQAIESGTQMPAVGLIQLDQALTVKSDMSLIDGGILVNAYKSDQYPLNCSAQCYGTGIGYADSITRISSTRWRVDDPAVLVNYRVGSIAHFFRYDGYFDNIGQLCARRTIVGITDNVLTLSAGIDARCNRAKWYWNAAPIVQDVRIGQIAVSVPSTQHAALFSRGDYVMISAGADVANSDHCEFHRVVGIQSLSIQLESTTLRAYRTPVIAKYGVIRDVTIRNVTIQQPVNTGATGAFFKYMSNARFENVTFYGGLALGSCSNITLSNCRVIGEFGMNACSDIAIVNCTVDRLAMEECCFAIEASGCTFGPHEVPLQCSVGCERLTFRACKVTGGSTMPVAIGGPDMTFDDFTIEGTTRSLYAYFSGDRLRVRRLRCDPNCEPVIYGGSGIVAESVQARQTNLGWIDGSTSSGNAIGCQNPLNRQGNWLIVP